MNPRWKPLLAAGLFCLHETAHAITGTYVPPEAIPSAACGIRMEIRAKNLPPERKSPSDRDEDLIPFQCSGTLVAFDSSPESRVIVTAGHCLEVPFENARATCGGQQRVVTDARAKWGSSYGGPHDVGLVFTQSAFHGIRPLRAVEHAEEARALQRDGTKCLAFGFGVANDGRIGKLHAVVNPYSYYYSENSGYVRKGNRGEDIIRRDTIRPGDSGGGVICRGDDDEYRLVSVNSGAIHDGATGVAASVWQNYDWLISESRP